MTRKKSPGIVAAMSQARQAEAALLSTTIIWSISFTFTKISLLYTTPCLLIALRYGLSGVVAISSYYRSLKGLTWRILWQGILLGVFVYFSTVLQTVGLRFIIASRSAFLTSTFAIYVPFFQCFLLGHSPKKHTIIGLVFLLAGVYFLSGVGSQWTLGLGEVTTLAGAFLYACSIVLTDRATKRSDARPFIVLHLLTIALLAIVGTLFFEKTRLQITWPLGGSILYLGIVSGFVPAYLVLAYQRYVSPTKSALIYGTMPLFGFLFGALILGERMKLYEIIGAILIMTGILVSEIWGGRMKE